MNNIECEFFASYLWQSFENHQSKNTNQWDVAQKFLVHKKHEIDAFLNSGYYAIEHDSNSRIVRSLNRSSASNDTFYNVIHCGLTFFKTDILNLIQSFMVYLFALSDDQIIALSNKHKETKKEEMEEVIDG